MKGVIEIARIPHIDGSELPEGYTHCKCHNAATITPPKSSTTRSATTPGTDASLGQVIEVLEVKPEEGFFGWRLKNVPSE